MRRRASRKLIGLLVVAGAMLAPAAANATTYSVDVSDDGDPATYSWSTTHIDAEAGDTVNWYWNLIDDFHSLHLFAGTDIDGDPPPILDSGTFDPASPPDTPTPYTFTTEGTYTYVCGVHTYMTGTVQVGPAGSPAFTISGAPKIKKVRAGKLATFTATARNIGDAEATGASVCISGPATKIKFTTAKCKNYATWAAGATKKPTFSVKPKPAARGKTVKLTLSVDSAETTPVKTTVSVKVPR